MLTRVRLGWLLVVVGVGIAVLSLTVGGSTARACPGLDESMYGALGVHPAGVELTGLDLADATVEWYDGCNWRTNSAVPLALGTPVSLAGAVALARQRLDS